MASIDVSFNPLSNNITITTVSSNNTTIGPVDVFKITDIRSIFDATRSVGTANNMKLEQQTLNYLMCSNNLMREQLKKIQSETYLHPKKTLKTNTEILLIFLKKNWEIIS